MYLKDVIPQQDFRIVNSFRFLLYIFIGCPDRQNRLLNRLFRGTGVLTFFQISNVFPEYWLFFKLVECPVCFQYWRFLDIIFYWMPWNYCMSIFFCRISRKSIFHFFFEFPENSQIVFFSQKLFATAKVVVFAESIICSFLWISQNIHNLLWLS